MHLPTKLALVFGGVLATVFSLLSASERDFTWLEGVLFDGALALRHIALSETTAANNVAVIGVNAETLAHKDFSGRPIALQGPNWARLINALDQAGAKSINFDLVFEYSADQFKNEEGLNILEGFDTSFRRALYNHRAKLTLAYSAQTLPAQAYSDLISEETEAFGLINLEFEKDNIIREIPLEITDQRGSKVLTFLGAAIEQSGISTSAFPKRVLLSPSAHPEEIIPSYKLEHFLECAQTDPGSLMKAVEGRVVFIGWVGEEEDRKVSSARFISAPARKIASDPGCGLKPNETPLQTPLGISGVYLWAQAAEQLLSDNLTKRADRFLVGLTSGAAAVIGTVVGFSVLPFLAFSLLFCIALSLWGLEIFLLGSGLWLPVGWPIIGVSFAGILAYIIRFLLEERRRRRIQRAFGYYLAPSMVSELIDTEAKIKLGGEKREITVMFADLSGFTALSSKLEPERLITITNRYLGIITEEIENYGGYVDKYIGDSVMAVWGAPVICEDHAERAVEAGRALLRRVETLNTHSAEPTENKLEVKVSINTGDAIVGNVGSKTRLNYTVIGETVNIAARLENLPSVYSVGLIISDRTALKLKTNVRLRELDEVRLKGLPEKIKIFEPLN